MQAAVGIQSRLAGWDPSLFPSPSKMHETGRLFHAAARALDYTQTAADVAASMFRRLDICTYLRDSFMLLGCRLSGGAANGERLARIEGFLGVGMPEATAPKAAGAASPEQHPGEAQEPGPT